MQEQKKCFPQGKKKAVTFSYDDGVIQDKRLIAILDKYGLKATFNLNSERFSEKKFLDIYGGNFPWEKIDASEVKELYKNHEVAAHTLTHPFLPNLSDDEVIRQVEEDRKNLSKLAGYEVVGMAYPCGGQNNDDRVAKLIKEHTGVKYARTITTTGNFDLQDNLYRFNPTAYHLDFDKLYELGEAFLNAKPEEPMIFYIWGHSYEFDGADAWDKFEEFCRFISGAEDVFYGTNREVFVFC